MSVIKKYSQGMLTFHEHYMIAVMNEGVTVTPDLNDELCELALEHFGSKKFVYITHRKNSYSVDPSTYFETSKIKSLVGFAVVLADSIKIDNTDFERTFISKPFKSFNSLEQAIAWADVLCGKNN